MERTGKVLMRFRQGDEVEVREDHWSRGWLVMETERVFMAFLMAFGPYFYVF